MPSQGPYLCYEGFRGACPPWAHMQFWRAISLSTPPLWASLHVVVDLSLQKKVAGCLETTKKFWLWPAPLVDFSTTRKILEALTPFVLRWQHLHFASLPAVLQLMSHLEIDAPALETFIFEFPHDDGQREPKIEWGALELFCSRSHVCSRCLPAPMESVDDPFDWWTPVECTV
ncbi:hypothetical protein K438DRAFT_1814706 [Mycena galopus ATCC 62051]|nr:hypothetical protein K438DRAFT_1814706 [Mycena galopus ATCC 62051]